MRFDDDDLEEEIRAHLVIAAGEKVDDGADPDDARCAALREFGNVALMKEATRGVWMPWWLEPLRNLAGDVLYAVRALARNPVFSLTVVAVLTLGIGLNAAVFTMLKSFTLSPLAGVENTSRLATVYAETSAGRPIRLSYPDYTSLRDSDKASSGLLGSVVATANLGRGKGARIVWVELVSGNYFQVLNVRAERGRTLLPQDEAAPGASPVAVISDSLWRRSFGADPGIVGRTVDFNNTALTVVGIADPSFKGTTVVYDVEAFIPVTMGPALGYTFGSREKTPAAILADRRAAVFHPQGYLRPGVTLENAAGQANAAWAATAAERPADDLRQRLRVVPFLDTPGGAPSIIRPTLGILTAMALLVLTIACANIAGLVLVRGVSRRGEIALRMALGASRTRIVRLLLVENLVLAAPGTLFGVLLAYRLLPVFVGYAEWLAAPQLIYFNLDLDVPVIAFSVLAACGSALIVGFIPALRTSRVDLVSVINEDASPRGSARGRGRAGLVVAQVAVSLLLLVGSGLAARSVDAARSMDPGFDASHVASVTLDVSQNGYDEARGQTFYRRLLDAAASGAGIESAALAAYQPLGMTGTKLARVEIEGHAARRDEDLMFMSNIVSPAYFRTLRVPLIAGRSFEDADDHDGAPVIIVNRVLAERFWSSAAAAIGQRIRVGGGEPRVVVGVARELKYTRIDEDPQPYFYLPLAQSYRSLMVLHARAGGRAGAGPMSDEALVAQARQQVAKLDPEMPVISARPLKEEIGGAFIFLDLTSVMLFVFGIAGVCLAAMGTYGLISYAVTHRAHEIGVRMALGASARSIVLEFLVRGLTLGAAGAAIGIGAALAAGGVIGSMFFGVSPTDPGAFARALAIVFGGVALATMLPAWRAARTSPLTALRHQ